MPGVYRDPKMLNAAGQPAFIVWFLDVDGRTRRRFRTDALSRKEALIALADHVRKVNAAKEAGLGSFEAHIAIKTLTFSKYVEGPYSEWSSARNRKSTQKRKDIIYNNLKKSFGLMPLSSITSRDIEQYMSKRLAGKLSDREAPRPGTVNRERAMLSNILNRALIDGLIQRNPVQAVEALDEDNETGRPITPEEEAVILKACPIWLRELLQVGIHTGMRASEIRNLKWSDVDLKRRFIYVSDSKTHKPRHVPMNDVVFDVVSSKAPFPGQKVEKPYVFGNPETEQPYNVSSISHGFRKAADSIKDAQLGDVTFHSSRHTFVSRMIEAGTPERKVMAITGHKTLAMITRYLHLSPDGLTGTTDVLAPKRAEKSDSAVPVPYENTEKKVANASH